MEPELIAHLEMEFAPWGLVCLSPGFAVQTYALYLGWLALT